MKITYKKLWHLLIDKEMNKKDLIEKADISQSTLYKLTKDGNVNTDILISPTGLQSSQWGLTQ